MALTVLSAMTEIAGAERIKPKRLRKEIKLRLNQPVSEQQLEEARQKIIEVYQGRGYTDWPRVTASAFTVRVTGTPSRAATSAHLIFPGVATF